MKLSKTQQRALGKLTGNWKCAYELQERLPTLWSLVRGGFAQSENSDMKSIPVGHLLCPRHHIYFRLHGQEGK